MKTEEESIIVTAIEPPGELIEQRAANSILFVPNNWSADKKDHFYPSTVGSVIKVLKQNDISVDTLDPIDATTLLQDNRGIDWIIPTFFVSDLLLTQNPMLISLALNIIGNYVTDLFKGLNDDPKVEFEIIQTFADGEKAQRICYKGPVSGISEVEKLLSTFDSQN